MGCWNGLSERFCLLAARMGLAVLVEPAAEVCRWWEWYGFDSVTARKGSAVLVEPAAEVCRWSEWYGFD